MKRIAFAAALLCTAAGTVTSAYAAEPCEVTLCLWGKMNGENSSDCQNAVKKFFGIKKKSDGSFRPDKTLNARKSFLTGECPASYGAAAYVDKVLGKYGRQKNG